LAATVRAAKVPLARAIHRGELEAVRALLIPVLTAWSDPDGTGFTTLLDAAAETERVAIWRRAGGRIWNAVLLAAAGIVLPALPIYHSDPSAALGARYSLLLAAAFALTTGKVSAWDTVSSELERLDPAPPGRDAE